MSATTTVSCRDMATSQKCPLGYLIGSPTSAQVPGSGIQPRECSWARRMSVFAVEQVDEAVIGKLRHQGLGNLAQGDIQLKGAGQALADPLQQADPVTGALAAAPGRLPSHDHDAGDLAAPRHAAAPHAPVRTPGIRRCAGWRTCLPRASRAARSRPCAARSQRRDCSIPSESSGPADQMRGLVGEAEQRYREGSWRTAACSPGRSRRRRWHTCSSTSLAVEQRQLARPPAVSCRAHLTAVTAG